MNTRNFISAVSLLSVVSFAHAAAIPTIEDCNHAKNKEACLQEQAKIDATRAHQVVSRGTKSTSRQASNTADDVMSRIHIGVDPAIPKDQLVVSMDRNEKDIELLRERHLVNSVYGNNRGFQAYISGKAELTANRDSVVSSGNKNDVFPDASADVVAQANDWLIGLAEFKVSDAEGANKDQVRLDQGLVTLGNLDKSPLYATIGDYYMPFGRYNSYMVSDSLPKQLGGTKAKAITIGLANARTLNGNVFFMEKNVEAAVVGATRPSQNEPWGASIDIVKQLNDFNIKTSLSYVNSMANGVLLSSKLCGAAGGTSCYGAGAKDSNGADTIVTVGYGPVEVSADYLTALDDMKLGTSSSTVRPHADNLEVRYKFKTLGKNSDIAVSYGQTKHIADLPLPSEQYGATYSVAINDYITTDLEYVTKKDININGAKKDDHVVTGDVVVWF